MEAFCSQWFWLSWPEYTIGNWKSLIAWQEGKRKVLWKKVYFGLWFPPVSAPLAELVCDYFNLHVKQQPPQGQKKSHFPPRFGGNMDSGPSLPKIFCDTQSGIHNQGNSKAWKHLSSEDKFSCMTFESTYVFRYLILMKKNNQWLRET